MINWTILAHRFYPIKTQNPETTPKIFEKILRQKDLVFQKRSQFYFLEDLNSGEHSRETKNKDSMSFKVSEMNLRFCNEAVMINISKIKDFL